MDFPVEKMKKREESKHGGRVGSLGNGEKKRKIIYPSEQGGEDLEEMSCFCYDDLKLAVGHPGKFMGRRGWVEMPACELSEG